MELRIREWSFFVIGLPRSTYVYLSSIIFSRAHARSLYTFTHVHIREPYLYIIAYFALLPPNTPKNSNFVTCLFSVLYKESVFFLAFFCKNIWSCQKFVVLLHSLLRNKCVSIFYRGFRTLKFRFSFEDLIFLRQTEVDGSNWKIDTISVVQELNENVKWQMSNDKFKNGSRKKFYTW